MNSKKIINTFNLLNESNLIKPCEITKQYGYTEASAEIYKYKSDFFNIHFEQSKSKKNDIFIITFLDKSKKSLFKIETRFDTVSQECLSNIYVEGKIINNESDKSYLLKECSFDEIIETLDLKTSEIISKKNGIEKMKFDTEQKRLVDTVLLNVKTARERTEKKETILSKFFSFRK